MLLANLILATQLIKDDNDAYQ